MKQMKPIRRLALTLPLLASMVAGVLVASPIAASAATHKAPGVTTVTLYSQLGGPAAGTTLNIWTNVLIPMFEKSHPGIKVAVTFASGNSDQAILDRILAAIKAKQPSPYDLVDPNDVMIPLVELHDGVPLSQKQIPLMSQVSPAWIRQMNDEALPFRGSWVILAYNSHYVKNPPKTLAALETWIKSNPGKFTYCSPSSGGSGDAFAETVVNSFIPPALRSTFVNEYKPGLESYWTKGLDYLTSLGKSMYRGGYYPNGNLAVDQLLSSGAIWMAPQWSDIATSSLRVGALPPFIKLLQPLPPFNGGPADLVIPINATHKAAAEVFENWLLTPPAQEAIVHIMGGFPGVEYKYMPPAIQRQFAPIAQHAPAEWFSTQFGQDLAKKWQAVVAGS